MFPPMQSLSITKKSANAKFLAPTEMTHFCYRLPKFSAKNHIFECFGSCEQGRSMKIARNLDNIIVYLVSKGFCSSSKNGFLPQDLVIFLTLRLWEAVNIVWNMLRGCPFYREFLHHISKHGKKISSRTPKMWVQWQNYFSRSRKRPFLTFLAIFCHISLSWQKSMYGTVMKFGYDNYQTTFEYWCDRHHFKQLRTWSNTRLKKSHFLRILQFQVIFVNLLQNGWSRSAGTTCNRFFG